MKKIKCLLILSLVLGLFYKPITSSANEVLDEGVKEIEVYGQFNYFRGVTKEEYESNGPLDLFYSYFDGPLESGTLEHTVKVKNTVETEYKFQFTYEYVDWSMTYAKIYFNDTLIYHATFEGEYLSEVKKCEKIIVEKFTKVKNDYFTITSYGDLVGMYDYEYTQSEMEEIGLFLIHGHRYIYNPEYAGKDVYFVTTVDNLISFDDIKTKLTATDETDGDLTDKIRFYNVQYDPTSENITVGTYSFDAVVSDSSGNLTYQTCYVRVVDLENPVITVGEPMDVTYTLLYPHSYFLKRFTATDNIEVASIEVTEDTYTANYKIPGTYYITATATDTSGNTASATLTVNVIDRVAPTIKGPYEVTTTTQNPYTREELRNLFTFEDVNDDNVTEYTITDNDGYFENTKKPGKYSIRISAFDKYGNEGIKTFILVVKDLDYPSISVDSDYTIIIDESGELSKEQIVEFLNQIGLLEQEVVDVESACFDETNPMGTYEASIILEDGTVIRNKLVVTGDISYDAPVVDEVDFTVAIICGVLSIILLGAVVYFVRARRLQNRH